MINKRIENLLKKKEENELIVGSSVSASDVMISEAMAYSGFDLIWIDMEHTPLDKKEVLMHITAIQGAGKAALVRVPWNDPVLVKPILDIGPDGIIFPMVSNGEQAQLAVKSIAYPPMGIRGYGPLRANCYGTMKEYLEYVRKNILCFVQIETLEGVNNIEEICNCQGVDGILFGGMDLSASLGGLGLVDTSTFRNAVKQVAGAVKEAGRFLGCCAPDDEISMEIYFDSDVDIYLASGDISMLTAYAKYMVKKLQNARKSI